ncbi:MAG: nickel-dependent lactate racemase [Dethiobacter sp.]|jgi:nickel-dependent lactate racemase|nr:nickel-dependent lactate racemase [Dethiobacter sp.]
MLIKLLCGDSEVMLELPDNRIKAVLEPKPLPVLASEEDLVQEALSNPIDSAPLCELVRPGETACIIVSDMTRSWARHHVLLPPLLFELNKGGIQDKDIYVVFATGDHREQTPAEHRVLMGEEAYGRVKAYDHNARSDKDLVYLGATTNGTPVKINRRVAEADRVILTGGIVYHFLAGWGGGKKALTPGVSGYETIMKNHSLAFNPGGEGLNPLVCSGRIDGNPCCNDMEQAAGLAGPDFLVNTVINEDTHKIAKVVAGNFITAHREGCLYVDRHFRVNIDEQAEVVIASCGGYPKDINFYQSYKTIYNANIALRKGGTMVLLSESREGLGSDDFASILTGYSTVAEREAAVRAKYTIGGQMGYHTAAIAGENDVLVLSGLPDETVSAMGMIPVKTTEEALSFIRKKHGDLPPAYVLPHGGTTFPSLG